MTTENTDIHNDPLVPVAMEEIILSPAAAKLYHDANATDGDSATFPDKEDVINELETITGAASEPESPALTRRKLSMSQRMLKSRTEQLLPAAYLMAKGLAELLTVLDHASNDFSEIERAAIAAAHQNAYRVFASLNSIVIDKGQKE